MAQVLFILAASVMQVYRARHPKKSPLWQCVHRHCDEFEAAYQAFDAPRLVEKILRHLGAWHDPPAAGPPVGFPGASTHKTRCRTTKIRSRIEKRPRKSCRQGGTLPRGTFTPGGRAPKRLRARPIAAATCGRTPKPRAATAQKPKILARNPS